MSYCWVSQELLAKTAVFIRKEHILRQQLEVEPKGHVTLGKVLCNLSWLKSCIAVLRDQGVTLCNDSNATCLTTKLRDRFHKMLPSVTQL